jgi:Baseplate J-like protein
MTNTLDDELRTVITSMESHESQDNTQTPQDAIQDIYVLIVREHEAAADQTQIVDSIATVPTQPAATSIQRDSCLSAYIFVCFSLFLILATLTFQLYCMFNPLTATVTILPKSQTVTLTSTLQLGRVLPPLTISQSQTTPATGHGHQSARVATGTVTFFNGLFTQQFIASGTVYTGQDGVAIVTTEDAAIPAGSPSSGYGTATVTAQAVTAGTSGNIPGGDITITINNGLLVRNNQFSNGQDARTYTTVAQHDIHSISTVLKTTLANSITGALEGQRKPQEQIQLLPCTPTVTSDHQPGEEATTVKVTVSETCSAIAYNSQELQTKATSFLATQAQQKAGAGYSLFGTVQVSVKQATVSSTTPHLVFLPFIATGTWIYGISGKAQEQIKESIAGKNTQQAQHLLAQMPGVESATIRFSGFGDDTRLPKTAEYIHLSMIVV